MTDNGYENWATWETTLHLTNDQGLYETVVELLRPYAPQERPDALRCWVEAAMIPDFDGLAGSFVAHSFNQINWRQVVGHFDDDLASRCTECDEKLSEEDIDNDEEVCEDCRPAFEARQDVENGLLCVFCGDEGPTICATCAAVMEAHTPGSAAGITVLAVRV